MASLLAASALLVVSCSKDNEGTGIKQKEEEGSGKKTEVTGTIPDYADDYSAISSWDYHTKWNLANVHDPSIAYYDGYYYMYGTDASYGNEHLKAPTGRHFPGKRSKDLVNWEYIPGPMNDAPAWVKEKLNEIRAKMDLDPIASPQYGYWAPVIRVVGNKLRMYYCIVIDNYIKSGKATSAAFDGSWTERAFIGMCESSDPAKGVWEDKGFVTCSSSDRGLNWQRASVNDWNGYFYYNAIDPTYFVDNDAKHWLIHGSWHSGFTLLEINPETGMPVKTVGDPWADSVSGLEANGFGVQIGTRKKGSRWQGSEAPEIIYKDGYYYLFMAYDGLDVPYNTRVVRASSLEGPYYDINGTDFTAGEGDCYPIVTHPYKFSQGYGWVGISHCCVFQQNGTGDWFYCSQGRLPAGAGGNAYANAIMMGHVRRIVWCPATADNLDELWPIALPERYAGLTKATVTKADIPGTYEHINLVYKYGQQDTSSELILNESGTMSGALTGTWSFNQSKQFLTLAPTNGAKVVVVVAHEADWEASPRKATVVYAGTERGLKATWWGKKVK